MKSFYRSFAFVFLAIIATCALAFPASAFAHNQTEHQMKAQVGQIVIVKSGAVTSNGTNVAPAIITRGWNSADIVPGGTATGMVNVSVFLDAGHHVIPLTSVTLYATEADGDSVTAARTPEGSKPSPHFAFYPDGTYTERGQLVPVTRPDGGVDVVS